MSVEERIAVFTPADWTDVDDGDWTIYFNGKTWDVTFRLLDMRAIEELMKRKATWEESDEVVESMFIRYRTAGAILAVDGRELHEDLPCVKRADGTPEPRAYRLAKEEWSLSWSPPLLDALDKAYVDFSRSFLGELESMNNQPFTETSRETGGN